MKFGVAVFPTEDAQDPAELGRMVEQRGFDCLLFPEHTHSASRESRYLAGGELPPEYSHTYDPFVALTAAAVATARLLIGTGISSASASSRVARGMPAAIRYRSRRRG